MDQGLNTANNLRDGVRGAYGAAAEDPYREHPFPVGRRFAESLGYPPEQLARLPAVSVEAFAGVSNVAVNAEIPTGATVLDLGCGAGLDSLLAAATTGPLGKVIGVDFSASMLDRARRGASEAGLSNIEFRQADAERLPIEDASIDVALVNGIFNLNPIRDAIFRELARVVRPDGVVYVAELILRDPTQPPQAVDEANWFAWIAGAKEGGAFRREFLAAGFRDAVIVRTARNARTKSPYVLAADLRAVR